MPHGIHHEGLIQLREKRSQPQREPHEADGTRPASSKALPMKIGDLAKATGKSQRALRLYEEMRLLTPGTRTVGNFRVYGPEAIERVRWIGKLQELGFTLQQIQALIDVNGPLPKDAMANVRRTFADKQAEVGQQIARLQQLQRELASSLSYLETCVDSCPEAQSHDTACCGTCQTHGGVKAPSLVEGVREAVRVDGRATSPATCGPLPSSPSDLRLEGPSS